MKKIVFSLLFLISHLFLSHAVAQTIREQMSRIETAHKVSFVYDSALPLSSRYTGESLTGLSLEQSLERLFAHTPITYKVQQDGHVLLKAKKAVQEKTARWTVSGHVRDAQGETLINATVYDLTTHQGTLTNEYGYYSLTLSEGEHQLRITYVGYEQQTVSLKLTQNRVKDIRMTANHQLKEVVVTADMNSPVTGTQMGKRSLSQADIKTEFALFSSPDVVKTLQRISGVQDGIELASGLYVHGGNGDENLFLLDGTPLYSVNHSLGLFSSFNTDMV